MLALFIFEVVFLPLYLLSPKILHRYDLLTENRFGLIVTSYLSVMISTASQLFPTLSLGRIIGLILSVLFLFPGYFIAKWIYRQILLRSKQ